MAAHGVLGSRKQGNAGSLETTGAWITLLSLGAGGYALACLLALLVSMDEG